jgi:hypothetical protein
MLGRAPAKLRTISMCLANPDLRDTRNCRAREVELQGFTINHLHRHRDLSPILTDPFSQSNRVKSEPWSGRAIPLPARSVPVTCVIEYCQCLLWAGKALPYCPNELRREEAAEPP